MGHDIADYKSLRQAKERTEKKKKNKREATRRSALPSKFC